MELKSIRVPVTDPPSHSEKRKRVMCDRNFFEGAVSAHSFPSAWSMGVISAVSGFIKRIIFACFVTLLHLSLPFARLGYRVTIRGPWRLYHRVRYGKSPKRIVVIGGGFAGTEIAKQMQHFFQVDLVDTKSYFEFTPSILRTVVQPSKLPRIQRSHVAYLPKCTVHVGSVESIDVETKQIEIYSARADHTNSLPYDYAVIASGSANQMKFSNPNVVASYQGSDLAECHNMVRQSNRVLVIGGGYVGVEIAAEIIEKYPRKEVTLIHSGSRLLERGTEKASAYALRYFRSKRVNVCLDEPIDFDSLNDGNEPETAPVCISSKKGTKFEVDLAFVCIGASPSSSFCSEEHTSKKGRIRVNSSLQTTLASDIFCCGDVVDVSEEKLAQTAQRNAWVTIENIMKMEHSQGRGISNYQSSSLPLVISLGKHDGIFTWHGLTVGGFVPALMKEVVEWKVLAGY